MPERAGQKKIARQGRGCRWRPRTPRILQGLWEGVQIQGQLLGVCISYQSLTLSSCCWWCSRGFLAPFTRWAVIGWWDQSKSDWCEPYRSVHRSTAHRDKGTQSWWKTQILCYLGRGNWAQTMPAYADLGKTTHCQKTGFLTWMRMWRGKGGVACKDGAREGWRDVKHCVEVAGTAPQVRSLTDRGNCLSILPKLDFFLIFPSWGIFCVSSFPTGGSSFDIFTKCPTGSNNWILKLGRPSRPMNPLKLCEKYGLQLFFFFLFFWTKGCPGEAAWCRAQIPGFPLFDEGPLCHNYHLVVCHDSNDGVGKMKLGERTYMKYSVQPA